MARRVKEKPTSVTTPSGVELPFGSQVRYYRQGWRVGTLESVAGTIARVRPMSAIHANPKRSVNVEVSCLEPLNS